MLCFFLDLRSTVDECHYFLVPNWWTREGISEDLIPQPSFGRYLRLHSHGPHEVKQPKQQMRMASSWRFRRVRALAFFGRWRPLMPRVVFFVEKMRILTLKIFFCPKEHGDFRLLKMEMLSDLRAFRLGGTFRERMAGKPVKTPGRTQNSMIFHLPTGAVIWGIHWGIHEDYYFLILKIIWES